MRRRFFIGAIFLVVTIGLVTHHQPFGAWISLQWRRHTLPKAVIYEEVGKAQSPSPESPPIKGGGARIEGSSIAIPPPPVGGVRGGELPPAFNLAVPFTSQAPLGVWDHLHEEACEEAAVLMADAFYRGRALTPQVSDADLQTIIAWETRVFGHWEDTTAEETARVLREHYGYAKVTVILNPTLEFIKREVLQGHLVLLPTAGRLLHNPYFSGAGPLYHMILVRGWTNNGMMITNDPGTKRGEGYVYAPEVLMNAIHDWNGGDVTHGSKAVIVVEK